MFVEILCKPGYNTLSVSTSLTSPLTAAATMAIPDAEVERQIQQMIQFIDHEADEKEVEILAKVTKPPAAAP